MDENTKQPVEESVALPLVKEREDASRELAYLFHTECVRQMTQPYYRELMYGLIQGGLATITSKEASRASRFLRYAFTEAAKAVRTGIKEFVRIAGPALAARNAEKVPEETAEAFVASGKRVFTAWQLNRLPKTLGLAEWATAVARVSGDSR